MRRIYLSFIGSFIFIAALQFCFVACAIIRSLSPLCWVDLFFDQSCFLLLDVTGWKHQNHLKKRQVTLLWLVTGLKISRCCVWVLVPVYLSTLVPHVSYCCFYRSLLSRLFLSHLQSLLVLIFCILSSSTSCLWLLSLVFFNSLILFTYLYLIQLILYIVYLSDCVCQILVCVRLDFCFFYHFYKQIIFISSFSFSADGSSFEQKHDSRV